MYANVLLQDHLHTNHSLSPLSPTLPLREITLSLTKMRQGSTYKADQSVQCRVFTMHTRGTEAMVAFILLEDHMNCGKRRVLCMALGEASG